jgi:hypothetical protein
MSYPPQPAPGYPASAQSFQPGSRAPQPAGYAQPGYAQPGYAQPGYAQPGYAQPGYAQPGYAQPGYAQPGHPQPGHSQPGYAQPGYPAAQPGYPAPVSGHPGAQPGFPPPPAPVYPSQAPAGYAGAAGEPACRLCGCVPAAQVTFRQHRGMLVIMQFIHSKGPFCRDCGLAVFRTMTAKTLIQGWWGYASSVITPVTVLINAFRRGKVASLPAPRPPQDGRPYRRPLDPGPALFARPSALIGALLPGLALLLIIGLVVVSAVSSSS